MLFLRQARSQCQTLHFTSTDISAALVLETMLHIQDALPDLQSSPYVLDLEAQSDLTSVFAPYETAASKRVLSCFGMIPNFEYHAFLPYIRRLMRPGDLLLLSVNLSPRPFDVSRTHILPQYDNPLAHAWFSGLLDSLGFPSSQIRITVQAAPLRADGEVWQIQAYATCLQSMTVTVYEESFTFTPDEHLHLFFSNRFTPQVMPHILEDAGLHPIETLLLNSHEEGIYVCTSSA